MTNGDRGLVLTCFITIYNSNLMLVVIDFCLVHFRDYVENNQYNAKLEKKYNILWDWVFYRN